MTIGERIKKRRNELGMTQQELANKLGYKSKSSINKIELNGRNLTQRKIKLIADALQTTPEYIMGWDKEYHIETEIPYTKASLNIALTDPRFQKIMLDYFNMPIEKKELFCDFYEKFIKKLND